MFELLLSSVIRVVSKGVWSSLDAVNTPANVVGAATATYKTDVFFVGGNDKTTGTELNTCYKYSVSSNTFTPIANLPMPLRGHKLIAGDNRLYVWGCSPTEANAARFYMYNIATNAWTTVAQPSAALSPGCENACLGNIGVDLYILGGARGAAADTGSVKFIRYNQLANTWTALADCPQVITHAAFKPYNNRFYAVYGSSDNGATPSNTLLEYNIATNVWSTKIADLSTVNTPSRLNPQVMLFGEALHFVSKGSDVISSYNPLTNVYVPDYKTRPSKWAETTGYVCQNKWYGLSDQGGVVYDPYDGMAKPSLVIIPFQEWYTNTAWATAFGYPTSGTDTWVGVNWYVIRYKGATWIIPEKSPRDEMDLNTGQAAMADNTRTVNGVSYSRFSTKSANVYTNDPWALNFGRIIRGYLPSIDGLTMADKIASFDQNTFGFGLSIPGKLTYNASWTNDTDGANATQTRGGADVGTRGSFNNFSGRAGVMPFIRVNSGPFPW